MDAFPAFFPLAGRTVIVVGEGAAADNKARLFYGSPAKLVRLDEAAAISPGAFDGAALVFIASHDEALIEQAAALARTAGAVVNVVDHPALCDFYTPAVIDRGAVVAAVGASGSAPLLAAMLRNDIEAQVPEGSGRVAALFRITREDVRAALPDLDERRAFLRETISGPAAEAAMAGDMDLAALRLREALAAFKSGARIRRAGRIDFIIADGPAELLSLKAARALGQADVLIADPHCPPDIAAMARRDARRPAYEGCAAAELAAWARDGLRVVRVQADPPDPATIEALAKAGAQVSVLRQAAV